MHGLCVKPCKHQLICEKNLQKPSTFETWRSQRKWSEWKINMFLRILVYYYLRGPWFVEQRRNQLKTSRRRPRIPLNFRELLIRRRHRDHLWGRVEAGGVEAKYLKTKTAIIQRAICKGNICSITSRWMSSNLFRIYAGLLSRNCYIKSR